MFRRLVLLPVLFAAACATAPAPATTQYESLSAPTPDDVALRITAADNGRTIQVKAGTKIAIELIGTPTAGYQWQVVEQPPIVTLVGEIGGATSTAQQEAGFAGGNHWEVFILDVTSAGVGLIRLDQRQPFGDAAEPAAAAFSVTIEATC